MAPIERWGSAESGDQMRNHDAAHAVSPGESFSRLRNAQAASGEQTVSDRAHQHAILIVDDKPELLNSLHQLVNLHGYQADKALGGQEALDALGRKHYDVVLLDAS